MCACVYCMLLASQSHHTDSPSFTRVHAHTTDRQADRLGLKGRSTRERGDWGGKRGDAVPNKRRQQTNRETESQDCCPHVLLHDARMHIDVGDVVVNDLESRVQDLASASVDARVKRVER